MAMTIGASRNRLVSLTPIVTTHGTNTLTDRLVYTELAYPINALCTFEC